MPKDIFCYNSPSDDLPVQGYNIKNTLKGDQECSSNSVGLINAPVRSYYTYNRYILCVILDFGS